MSSPARASVRVGAVPALLLVLGAGWVVGAAGDAPPGPPQPPSAASDQPTPADPASPAPAGVRNVVFILSDDHRFDFMGFMDGAPPFLETPHMDRMAKTGAHLEHAFVSTSLCSPSRASILTGRYAHNHGVVDNSTPVPPGTTFFPEHLQQAGYRTSYVGKWHMGHDDDDPRPGFDHWVSFRGQGAYYDPVLNVNGERAQVTGYTTDLLTDHAIEWLEAHQASEPDRPFFLYLSHKAVHHEFEPAPRHRGRYADRPIPYPATMANTETNYRGKPRWVEEQRYSWHGVDHLFHGQMGDFDHFYRSYCETLLALDDSVGRVLDHLEASGLLDSTLVIYMGDNGFMMGEHGLIDKRQAYEPSMRVPMLAVAPGLIAPGSRVTDVVRNIDIAPTVLDYLGVESPEPMDGRSFLPALRGEPLAGDGELFYEYYWEYAFPHTPTTLALRGDRYKFIYYPGVWDLQEFYDLETDPDERHNLIDLPEHQQRIAEMRGRLWDRLEAADAMLVPLRRGNWSAGERKRY